MEYISFKIKPIYESEFISTFEEIAKELNVTWRQLEYDREKDYTEVRIPDYCIDKFSVEQRE